METIESFIENNSTRATEGMKKISKFISEIYGKCYVNDEGVIDSIEFLNLYDYVDFYALKSEYYDENFFTVLDDEGRSVKEYVSEYIDENVLDEKDTISAKEYLDFAVDCSLNNKKINRETEKKHFVDDKVNTLYESVSQRVDKEEMYKAESSSDYIDFSVSEKITVLSDLLKELKSLSNIDDVTRQNITVIESKIKNLKNFDIASAENAIENIFVYNSKKCEYDIIFSKDIRNVLIEKCREYLLNIFNDFDPTKLDLSINDIVREVLSRLDSSTYTIEYDVMALLQIVKRIKPMEQLDVNTATSLVSNYLNNESSKTSVNRK